MASSAACSSEGVAATNSKATAAAAFCFGSHSYANAGDNVDDNVDDSGVCEGDAIGGWDDDDLAESLGVNDCDDDHGEKDGGALGDCGDGVRGPDGTCACSCDDGSLSCACSCALACCSLCGA
mmetsp:Transcript_2327/g.5480  ORF Transcript_2327/g.5480 Transcript_2327/m.5480 type:complete len:123 (-) Transcript_2327:1368-1736(-)